MYSDWQDGPPDAALALRCPGIGAEGWLKAAAHAAQRLPIIEAVEPDMLLADLAGLSNLLGPLNRFARSLMDELTEIAGKPLKGGLGETTLVALTAMGLADPGRLFVVPRGVELKFLEPLPLSALPVLSAHDARELHGMGVRFVGELAGFPRSTLEAVFGEKALSWSDAARGVWKRPIVPRPLKRAVLKSSSFPGGLLEPGSIREAAFRLVEEGCFALRTERLQARRLKGEVAYPDGRDRRGSRMLSAPTSRERDFYPGVKEMLLRVHDRRVRVTRLALIFEELVAFGENRTLFEDDRLKYDRLYAAKDEVRKKFGFEAIWDGARAPEPLDRSA